MEVLQRMASRDMGLQVTGLQDMDPRRAMPPSRAPRRAAPFREKEQLRLHGPAPRQLGPLMQLPRTALQRGKRLSLRRRTSQHSRRL